MTTPSAQRFGPARVPTSPAQVCVSGRVYAGQYLVTGLLGQGGMGEVYSVVHQTLHDEFAFKVLKPHYRVRDDIVMRFRAESRALWELKHPGFVQVHHAGDDPEIGPYIVMEVLRGKTLAQLLRMMGRLPVEQAVPMLIEACDTAHAMHLLGIIHRDIKPDNVFVTLRPDKTRAVKLLDLGAAKIAKYGQPATAENRTIGTGRYMSPEHIRCLPLGPSSDIYAVGHIAYELISGHHAFGRHHEGEPTHWDYQAWHLNAAVEPLHQVCPEVSEDLSRVLAQALAKKPEERFQTMLAFANALRAVLRQHLLARAKGGTAQMPTPQNDGTRTIEEALSRPNFDGQWVQLPSGEQLAPSNGAFAGAGLAKPAGHARTSTDTFEAQTAKDPISRGQIEGVPKSTQRMADAAQRPDVVAYLGVVDGPDAGKSFALLRQTYVVGREAGVDVYLPDSSLSQRHARIVVHPTGIIELFDEKSTNGTACNDKAIEYAVLKHLDRVRFGRVTLELRYVDPERLSLSSGTVRLDLSEPAPQTRASLGQAESNPPEVPPTMAVAVASAAPPAPSMEVAARRGRAPGAAAPGAAAPGAAGGVPQAVSPATMMAHPQAAAFSDPHPMHASFAPSHVGQAPAIVPTTPMGVPIARSRPHLGVSGVTHSAPPPASRDRRRQTGRVVVACVLALCALFLTYLVARQFGLISALETTSPPAEVVS